MKADLEERIRRAYTTDALDRKKEFIRKLPRRERNLRQMLGTQLQYMGLQLATVFGYSLALLLAAATRVSPEFARLVAALVPLIALIALTGLGKSARDGMEEIEMATRFSLRMLRILRLTIVGIAGLITMVSVSFILKVATGQAGLTVFAMVGIPYLLTTSFSMMLIRRWHSPKNIYGCAAIALAVCLMTAWEFRWAGLWRFLNGQVLSIVLIVLCLAFTVGEAQKYVKESEELQWNLS